MSETTSTETRPLLAPFYSCPAHGLVDRIGTPVPIGSDVSGPVLSNYCPLGCSGMSAGYTGRTLPPLLPDDLRS